MNVNHAWTLVALLLAFCAVSCGKPGEAIIHELDPFDPSTLTHDQVQQLEHFRAGKLNVIDEIIPVLAKVFPRCRTASSDDIDWSKLTTRISRAQAVTLLGTPAVTKAGPVFDASGIASEFPALAERLSGLRHRQAIAYRLGQHDDIAEWLAIEFFDDVAIHWSIFTVKERKTPNKEPTG